MQQIKTTNSFRHFAKHFFIVNKAYAERKKAKDELYIYLDKMKKSIIRMNLTYSSIEKLKQKIDNLVDWERKYAKFFRPEDKEIQGLKGRIQILEQELMNEGKEKSRITCEDGEKIKQLTESLANIKNQMKYLMLDKAKRQHRLKALETKIRGKVDVHDYYHS